MNKPDAIAAIRAKLASGEATIGSWMQLPSTAVAEIMGAAGYDWVAVDLEHGSFGAESLPDLFRALELGNTLPFVRLAEGTSANCKQALEAGAAGIIVPMIESGEQLQAVADACRWPPAGTRGVGFSRANLFGKRFNAYAKDEAQSPMLVAMIEHWRAVENIDAILAVPGLDAIFIGPYDLSASFDAVGIFDDPRVAEAVATACKSACNAGVPFGIHVVSPEPHLLADRIVEGHQFIAYSIDAVLLQTVAQQPVLGFK